MSFACSTASLSLSVSFTPRVLKLEQNNNKIQIQIILGMSFLFLLNLTSIIYLYSFFISLVISIYCIHPIISLSSRWWVAKKTRISKNLWINDISTPPHPPFLFSFLNNYFERHLNKDSLMYTP